MKKAPFKILSLLWIFAYSFLACNGNQGKEAITHPPTPTAAKDTTEVNNQWFCSTYEAPAPKGVQQAVAQNGKQWPTGSTLHVAFNQGTATQRLWPMQAFAQWGQYANLKFDYPTTGPYDCTISFDPLLGAWSYIGTDSKGRATSMNLGWTGMDVSLHEIGHFLSLLHEQSSPVGNICWNKAKVYSDLGGPPNNWSKSMVDNNVFFKYNQADVTATEFDPISIMEYQLPGSWICSGVGIPGGKVLSEKDKFLIARLYPGLVVTPPPPPAAGVTLTQQQAATLYAKSVSASNSATNALKSAQLAKNAADSVSINIRKAFGL